MSLASSRETNGQVLPEFGHLLEALHTVSARWLQTDSANLLSEGLNPQGDLAGRYAEQLEQLYEACRANPAFRFDFFDHSFQATDVSRLSPIEIVTSDLTREAIGRPGYRERHGTEAAQQRRHPQQVRRQNVVGARSAKRWQRTQLADGAPMASLVEGDKSARGGRTRQNASQTRRRRDISVAATPASVSQSSPTAYFPDDLRSGDNNNIPDFDPASVRHPINQVSQAPYQAYVPEISQDALHILSDTLMDPQYMELDRVITFENTDFNPTQFDLEWA